ncbi:hypothetical protein [Lactobacillus sp. PV012]|uniref:hypothetical protein n=1 Tax=Lactobacillus sp. PV012 TaxID=2594494 RepID=UPI00223F1ED4|nr:hypothetical protein [Lactobacillus sp. PV012]QNQ82190.1 hypothetical protein FP433_03635 [Lactobacillus sp. PV012]
MKPKKTLTAFIASLSLMSNLVLTTSNKVNAAYYRGKKVTTPKSIRGTWYTYNKFNDNRLEKLKITAHTVTYSNFGSYAPHGTYTLYNQSKKIYQRASGDMNYINMVNKYATKHHWMVAWNYKYKGHQYLGIDPFWLDLGDNNFGGGLRTTSIHKKRKTIKQLILQNPNSVKKYYKSVSTAKLLK